jgi:tryptophanyl-tRNA synthetase
MYTDAEHLKLSDPGKVEGNVVFTYLDAFHPDLGYIADLKNQYQQGGLGDGTVKKVLESCLQACLQPIRDQRAVFMNDKAQLIEILRQGSERSQDEAQQVLNQVKQAFGLNFF